MEKTEGESFNLDNLDIITPAHYAKNGYPHREWTYLRKHAPVYWYDRPNVRPFWAVTKQADVIEISKQPRQFINAPRLLIVTREQEIEDGQMLFRHLLNMDPPEHGKYRDLVNRRFTPRAVRKLEEEVTAISRAALDELAQRQDSGGMIECDFVVDFAAKTPLDVVAALLGLPRQDRQQLFQWTNETIGAADPEFQKGTIQETVERAREGLFTYFSNLVQQRRDDPQDDLTSVVANAKVDGQSLPILEMLSYFLLLVVAGNETTRNATSGGAMALFENPEQWRMLQRNPNLLNSAVEEIVRFTTPVIQFARTAVNDYELRGRKIKAGDNLALFYPSANRDEEIFAEPFKFDITRDPNPHVAFGLGEHFCLGANLARLELEVIFRELSERVEYAELTGPPERLQSSFVGGVKHLPVRMKLRPPAG